MSEPPPAPPRTLSRERIVAVVFDGRLPSPRRLPLFAGLLAVLLHAALWLWATTSRPSLETWSAELAARVHAELSRQATIELPPPPAPLKEPPAPVEKVAHPPEPTRVPRASAPPPPAQAAAIISREPESTAPVDLTSETFVTGTANAYAGGVTTAQGTNHTAVLTGTVDPNAAPASRSGPIDRSSPIRLEASEWNCRWPRDADAEDIDEQYVLMRVVVRANGSTESASVLSDPGHGFGRAASACAMSTRFTPARDARGRPIRALSSPIRVRFTR